MQPARQITKDIYILMGVLPVNAYLIKGREPVLIDTGLRQDSGEFMRAVESLVDPADIKWLYLTHPDQDHVGSLSQVLERAPDARLVTTYLGLGILSLFTEIGAERVYLANPGEQLQVGERSLSVLRPPTFDNPATTALYDAKSRALFSSDSFGALLPHTVESASDLERGVLRDGQVLWATMDTPWLHKVDNNVFASELDAIRRMAPELVLSAHLPPAKSMTDWMVESLAQAPGHVEFVGPNQAALEAMLNPPSVAAAGGA